MIEILKDADAKGLNSEDYDGSRWAGRLTALNTLNQGGLNQSGLNQSGLNGGGKSEADVAGFDPARFDLALTVCVMRYVSDLHFGKVNPGLFHNRFDLDREKSDLASFVR